MSWQRASIQAAANYLWARINAGVTDLRTKVVYEGLLEVLDPSRRATRLQREMADAAKSAVAVQPSRERRANERRGYEERRRANHGPSSGVERRRGIDRRSGRDRRSGG